MLSIGSLLFGFILGLVLGTQIKPSKQFSTSSYVIIIIAGIIMAWQLGEYPFYDYMPFSTAFVSALIGIFVSKLIVARSS